MYLRFCVVPFRLLYFNVFAQTYFVTKEEANIARLELCNLAGKKRLKKTTDSIRVRATNFNFTQPYFTVILDRTMTKQNLKQVVMFCLRQSTLL